MDRLPPYVRIMCMRNVDVTLIAAENSLQRVWSRADWRGWVGNGGTIGGGGGEVSPGDSR